MEEHPVDQPIHSIEIDTIPDVQGSYQVGRNGVTRIEACQKSGMDANIPYVRVWSDDVCLAEFCQHSIVGVYFAAPVDPELKAAQAKAAGLWNYVNGICTTCEKSEAQCDCVPF